MMPNAKKDVSGYKHALSYPQNTLKNRKNAPQTVKKAHFLVYKQKNPGKSQGSRNMSKAELLFDVVLSDEVAFGVESADNVFIALEREVGLFASSGGHFNRHRAIGVLHGSNGVALSVLFEVGVARSERVGAGPEFDGVEHEAVNEAKADDVNTKDVEEEVDDRVEPLVAKRAVPLVKLFEASVATIAAREGDHAGANESSDTFFHFSISLRGFSLSYLRHEKYK